MEEQVGQDGWIWWSGLAALLLGFVTSLFLGALVAVAANLLAGASLTNPPGGVVILESVVQDGMLVAAAIVFAARFGGRPSLGQFGFRGTSWIRSAGLVIATYVAFLIFSGLWQSVFDVSTKEKVLDQLGVNTSDAALVAAAVFTCVIAPFCEELFFRGFLFRALRNSTGVWGAALVTGLVFGAVHIGSAPVVDLVPLAFLGFLLCLVYVHTGSLVPCIVLHAMNNAIAFGTTEGWPPGAVLLLVVLVLATISVPLFFVARASEDQ